MPAYTTTPSLTPACRLQRTEDSVSWFLWFHTFCLLYSVFRNTTYSKHSWPQNSAYGLLIYIYVKRGRLENSISNFCIISNQTNWDLMRYCHKFLSNKLLVMNTCVRNHTVHWSLGVETIALNECHECTQWWKNTFKSTLKYLTCHQASHHST